MLWSSFESFGSEGENSSVVSTFEQWIVGIKLKTSEDSDHDLIGLSFLLNAPLCQELSTLPVLQEHQLTQTNACYLGKRLNRTGLHRFGTAMRSQVDATFATDPGWVVTKRSHSDQVRTENAHPLTTSGAESLQKRRRHAATATVDQGALTLEDDALTSPICTSVLREPTHFSKARLSSFAEDYHRVKAWFDWRIGPDGGIRGLLRDGEGIATIPGFLPPQVAEDALSVLERLPDDAWVDTTAARDYGKNNIEHRFKSCQPNRLEMLMRVFEVPMPGILSAFNAAK